MNPFIVFNADTRKLRVEYHLPRLGMIGCVSRGNVFHLAMDGDSRTICGRLRVENAKDRGTSAGTNKLKMCPYCCASVGKEVKP